jgi:serine/threonine protein kinase
MNNDPMTCNPEWVDLFFRHQLSDDEQRAFEAHLSDCIDCRRRLEEAAAGGDVWNELRDSLQQCTARLDDLRPAAGSRDWAVCSDASVDHASVLKLLSPTDDDRMIGRLGAYEIVGIIGWGGMGIVLKALDTLLNRYVAIKVLAPQLGNSGAARRRFSREAQAAAAVVHDNVIEIHGVADAEGLPYLVMPYVRGPSLQRRLDADGPLAVVEILRIAVQAASGLAAAHAQGLVHRDVKPANILLADGVERVKLTDFGLARAADDASVTKTGMIAGTPQYMSPEQARGESVDQRSDLFSLGSVLYAMCTARAPFRAETSYGILRRITDEEPRPIREINPDIPQWLCQVIARLMSKRPDERFESAGDVAELLGTCLAHVQQPAVVSLPVHRFAARTPANLRRWPLSIRLVGAALTLPAAVATVALVLGLNHQRQKIDGTATRQEPAAPVAPITDAPVSHYRDELWQALRSLQYKRDEALSLIAGSEQELVGWRQPVVIPADADPETKAQIERKEKLRAAKIADISQRIQALRAERLDPIEPQIAFVEKKLHELPAAAAADPLAVDAKIAGKGPGESIYNDRLKRFKFRMDRFAVTDEVQMAQTFLGEYRHRRGNPPLTGVWGDPRTNSLIVVGPPEADQPIRQTIARMEGLILGIDLEDDSLEAQYRQFQNERTRALEQIVHRRIEIIEAEAREKPDRDQIKKLNRQLETEAAGLDAVERKLKAVQDGIERLRQNEASSMQVPPTLHEGASIDGS